MINTDLIKKCEKELKDNFEELDEICLYNQEKVLNAFKKNKIALRHFAGSTGYGYGDEGRDALNAVLPTFLTRKTQFVRRISFRGLTRFPFVYTEF